jgi:transposase-like protein
MRKRSTATAATKPAGPAAGRPARRHYDEAFQRQAVELWLRADQPGTQIARELGLSYDRRKAWKRRYRSPQPPVRTEVAAANRALKAELARGRAQRDILKNAGPPRRTAAERYQRSETMKNAHSVAPRCAAPDVSRSGSHAWPHAAPSARAQAAAALLADLRLLHATHRQRYGAPRRGRARRQRGQRHGVKRIARLRRTAGRRGRSAHRRVPRTTQSQHDQPLAANRLAQPSAPTGPNQIWGSDLPYVPTAAGGLFGAIILDLWSRRVVGWACRASLAATTVVAALRMA